MRRVSVAVVGLSTGPEVFQGSWAGSGESAGLSGGCWKSAEPRVSCLNDRGPPEEAVRKVQDPGASMAGDGRGGLEQTQSLAFGLPPPCRGVGEGEQSHPRSDLAGQSDDLAPDSVLGEGLQWQVPQASVFRGTDPVLAASTTTATDLEVRQLPPGRGWSRRRSAGNRRCPRTAAARQEEVARDGR